MMEELSPDEADAIVELFNIGMGATAENLSTLLGEEVALSVPTLRLTSRRAIAAELEAGAGADLCSVSETVAGAFRGEAMLLFRIGEGLALARRLLPDTPADSGTADGGAANGGIGEIEQDALTEIGNIILNGCLASFANLMDAPVDGGLPRYRAGPASRLIVGADDPLLYVGIDVAPAHGGGRGRALFLLDIASLDAFRAAMRRTLTNLGL